MTHLVILQNKNNVSFYSAKMYKVMTECIAAVFLHIVYCFGIVQFSLYSLHVRFPEVNSYSVLTHLFTLDFSLLDSGLAAHSIGNSMAELMDSIARDNLHNLWQAAQNKFTHAQPHTKHSPGQQVRHLPRYGGRPEEPVSGCVFVLVSISSSFLSFSVVPFFVFF